MPDSKRRSFLKRISFSLTALGILPFTKVQGRDAAPKKPKKFKGDFMHIVFFWLKNPEDEAARAKFLEEANYYTDNIDVIICRHIGTPAGTRREVIDSSYTYSMVTTFKNRADQDIYQEHPLHKKFIENAGDLWEKVVVYDSLAM